METNANLCSWHYLAQIFFQRDGGEWRGLNEQLLPQLPGNQNADRNWRDERPSSDMVANREGNSAFER